MKTSALVVITAFAAAAALADYEYEGEWSNNFRNISTLDVSPYNGYVYVADVSTDTIQYFTAAGSFLGSWGGPGFNGNGKFCSINGLECKEDGTVYVANGCEALDHWAGIQYFTPTGSFLGQWSDGMTDIVFQIGFAPQGAVYVSYFNTMPAIRYYTPTGSILGSWQPAFWSPTGVAVSPAGTVYVGDYLHNSVSYYTLTGSLLGWWGSAGTGEGQFQSPLGIDLRNDGAVFVADSENDRIQYFTAAGSFLGKFGGSGSGPGQFNYPRDVALSADGERVYVIDNYNDRVEYFRRVETTVIPASLGKVKALFK
jgi:tripartite motif-containing protein 71